MRGYQTQPRSFRQKKHLMYHGDGKTVATHIRTHTHARTHTLAQATSAKPHAHKITSAVRCCRDRWLGCASTSNGASTGRPGTEPFRESSWIPSRTSIARLQLLGTMTCGNCAQSPLGILERQVHRTPTEPYNQLGYVTWQTVRNVDHGYGHMFGVRRARLSRSPPDKHRGVVTTSLQGRWRPYRVECTGSLPTSEVKGRRARLVLGWGTAREDLRVLPAFPQGPQGML